LEVQHISLHRRVANERRKSKTTLTVITMNHTAMGQVRELSRRINLGRATPNKELSSTGYCLAEPGVSYVVFAPKGGSFDVDLTATGGLLSVEWLHPTNGRSSFAETVAGGARSRFTGPAGEPVVLLLRNVSRS
jgi:hypothetical protein